MSMRTLSLVAGILLLLQQPLWHLWLYPGPVLEPWLTTAIAATPVLLALAMSWQGSRYAMIAASMIAILYFCHGVTEWIAATEQWPMAVTGIVLSLLLFFSLWFRLRGRE